MSNTKTITKPYFSNCLFEAVKAKIKKRKDIKIFRFPLFLNEVHIPHYYWKNLKTNLYYSFKPCDEKHNHSHFFFKGVVVEYMRDEQDAIINYYLRSLIKRMEKKLDFSSDLYNLIKQNATLSWNDYYPNLIKKAFTDNNPYPYIEGASKTKDNKDIIKFYDIGENGIINPEKDEIIYWRIPSKGKPM